MRLFRPALGAIALTAAMAAAPAGATDKISYNYGSTFWLTGDDFEGVSVLASGQVNRSVRLSLDYRFSDVNTDVTSVDVDAHTAFAGAGWMFRQWDKADVIVDLGAYFARVKAKPAGLESSTSDDGGAFLSLRGRILAAARVEVEPYVRYYHTLENLDVGDEDGFDFGLEGRYYFRDNLGVHLGVEESDFYNDTIFQLGVRFGQQRDLQNF